MVIVKRKYMKRVLLGCVTVMTFGFAESYAHADRILDMQKLAQAMQDIQSGFFYNNLDIFMDHIHYVFVIVIAHNCVLLLVGFYFAKLNKLIYLDQKTLSIETGIQNSGLGLLLFFCFFVLIFYFFCINSFCKKE